MHREANLYDHYFSNFGRHPVPDDLSKDSAPRHPRFFKGFNHIWAWRPSWSMNHDHFSNFSFPQPKEAPYEICAKLAQRLQRTSFEILNIFPIQMHKEAKLTSREKGQMSMYNHYFSNFGRPPVSDDICKDSATRHSRFWRTRFLKVFYIQMHREANLTLP